MALFHFHITQIKRSAGQSAIACAAYRAGEKLYSEYYGDISDYTHKGGVVCTGILLPSQASAEYQDRAPSGTPLRRLNVARKPSLHIALTLPYRTNFPWRKISLSQGNLFLNSLSAGA